VIDGLAVVDKPAGMTSHDVVARCRRIFQQRKVGHAGTLDPDATGVLLVGLGRATRLLQFHSGLRKRYDADIVLGVATSTLDAAGEVTGRWDQRQVTLDDARRAAAQLTGVIWQTPPMVSAVKVGGRRLHEMARRGLEVDRQPRQVEVTCFAVDRSWPAGEGAADARAGEPGGARVVDGALTPESAGGPDAGGAARPPGTGTLLSGNSTGFSGESAAGAGPVLGVRVECSAGTYVRVLAADLGAALGGGAHVGRLRRTAVGPWTEAMATRLEELSVGDVIAPVASLPWLEAVSVSTERAREIENGRVLPRDGFDGHGQGPWRVLGPNGDLLAVYQAHGADHVKPAVVLPPPI
jgi:tRNA pseudouridine55 synthase